MTPGETLMIGDTPGDMEAATRAGCAFQGYAPDRDRYEALTRAGARDVATSWLSYATERTAV
jgi:phosphoglycolate phosphatase-like HAD superfamily hydrolase